MGITVQDQEKRCMIFHGNQDKYLNFQYVVFGRGDHDINLHVKSGSGEENFLRMRELKQSFKFQSNRRLELCFQSLDYHSKTIDFHAVVEDQEFLQSSGHVTINHIDEQMHKIKETLQQFRVVSSNIYYKSEQDEELQRASKSVISTFNWLSVIKLLLMLLVCGLQVYFVTQFFNNSASKRNKIGGFLGV
ncbi:emp24 gp25l p24 family protein [Stylonychia lemnae]|uniref:Emp24 gp25l p24 family protein n=1 Tax=Stylonychia lemnae TaxID=5949 RepID=A0A078ANZ9_STYLE|nr:emp24 gp25l p24 family protein [Stylonychia lemnae]|eukprot:CDW83037.1 emp24 gp25l p24 family protein [Stylonychia lemnae]